MSKKRESKFDQFAEKLDGWLAGKEEGGEGLTLAQACSRLSEFSCVAKVSALSGWWQRRQDVIKERRLLGMITTGADLHKRVRTQFSKDAPPELQTLIDLHRVLVMQMSTQAATNPEMLKLADASLRTVLEFYSGQTKARQKDTDHQLAAMRLMMDSDEFFQRVLARAAELNAAGLSNAEQIAAMRQTFFADIEALAKSGTVVIPKA